MSKLSEASYEGQSDSESLDDVALIMNTLQEEMSPISKPTRPVPKYGVTVSQTRDVGIGLQENSLKPRYIQSFVSLNSSTSVFV